MQVGLESMNGVDPMEAFEQETNEIMASKIEDQNLPVQDVDYFIENVFQPPNQPPIFSPPEN